MLTFIIFIIVIGVLVLVHEFGHFVFAKRAGMKVEEFGFGFPPRLWGIKKNDTIYSINWIPFGGFVRIKGEEDEAGGPDSFSSKPVKSKLTVILAGVAMNFLLAAALLMVVNFMGLRVGILDGESTDEAQNIKIQIIEVGQNSPAEAADFRTLDEIIGFTGSDDRIEKISTAKEVSDYISSRPGENIKVVILRGSEQLIKEVTPRINPLPGQGALGVSLVLTGEVSYPWYESIWRGLRDTVILTVNVAAGYFEIIRGLIIDRQFAGEISGPIGIASLTGQAAKVGINYLLQFVALISVNLVILNALPFPALDGGRAVMILIEKAKGSPINKSTETLVNAVGFYLLIALMIYVTIKDISRFL